MHVAVWVGGMGGFFFDLTAVLCWESGKEKEIQK